MVLFPDSNGYVCGYQYRIYIVVWSRIKMGCSIVFESWSKVLAETYDPCLPPVFRSDEKHRTLRMKLNHLFKKAKKSSGYFSCQVLMTNCSTII